MRISGIYLAAGQSRRMGKHKLSLLLSPNKRLGAFGLENMRILGLHSITVVVREDDPLKWLPVKEGFRTVVCPDAASGMAASLRTGLQALNSEDPDAVLLMLADQPFISISWLSQLLSCFQEKQHVDFVAADSDGVLMPPAVLAKSMFPELRKLEGDQGARKLFVSGAFNGIAVPQESKYSLFDIDTPEEWETAKLRWNQE